MTDDSVNPLSPTAAHRWRGWVRDIAIFLLLLWGVIWFQGRDMLPTGGSITLPSVVLPRLDGEIGRIGPTPGKTTLVYFFAPWCSVCRNTIGHLETIDPQDTEVVVIALDYPDREAVEAFVAATGLNHPVHLGTRQTRDLFQVQGYPSYYVLDDAFRVVDRAMGYLTVLELQLRRL